MTTNTIQNQKKVPELRSTPTCWKMEHNGVSTKLAPASRPTIHRFVQCMLEDLSFAFVGPLGVAIVTFGARLCPESLCSSSLGFYSRGTSFVLHPRSSHAEPLNRCSASHNTEPVEGSHLPCQSCIAKLCIVLAGKGLCTPLVRSGVVRVK
eukprot:1724760-Amphidinium_carterae.1